MLHGTIKTVCMLICPFNPSYDLQIAEIGKPLFSIIDQMESSGSDLSYLIRAAALAEPDLERYTIRLPA
jgi:hypothetical protein